MNEKSKILLMSADPETQDAIGSLLESEKIFESGKICQDLGAMTQYLERRAVSVALVDIDREPEQTLRLLDPIINRFNETRFVILCTGLTADLVLRSMQIGARHVQNKGAIASELGSVLCRLSNASSSRQAKRGNVVTILSAAGGCGATTLTVNLANELSLTNGDSALIIDLDEHYGAVASYLQLQGEYGICDITKKDESRIDAELISSTAVSHSKGLQVLLSPASIDFLDPGVVRGERLGRVLKACSEAYKYTLIDAPRVPMDIAAELAGASDQTLIVLQLTVKDIRHCRLLLSALARRSVPEARIMLLVNRYRKGRQVITLKDVEKVLGNISLKCLSNDFTNALRGINYGDLLSKAAPRSTLRKELVSLAGQLSKLSSEHNGYRRS